MGVSVTVEGPPPGGSELRFVQGFLVVDIHLVRTQVGCAPGLTSSLQMPLGGAKAVAPPPPAFPGTEPGCSASGAPSQLWQFFLQK